MREIVIDGLVGEMAAAFGEGAEPKVLGRESKAQEWGEDEKPGSER